MSGKQSDISRDELRILGEFESKAPAASCRIGGVADPGDALDRLLRLRSSGHAAALPIAAMKSRRRMA